MGAQDNEALYTRFIDEVFNHADFSHLDQFLTPDYEIREAPPSAPTGTNGVKFVVGMFRSAFPDFRIGIDEVFADGNAVCACSTMRGTHRGAFMGFEPTGKQVAMTTLTLVHFRDGRIADNLVKSDIQALMKRIGAREAEPVR